MTIANHKFYSKEVFCHFLCFCVCFFSLEFSSSSHSLLDILHFFWKNITDHETKKTLELSKIIFWEIRIPRLLSTILCACAFGASGVISQAVFRNPLASPSIIGTTSGGSLGAVIAIALNIAWINSLAIPIMAFLGCLSTTLLVLFFISIFKNKFIDNLLLTGFAISTFITAITSFIISLISNDPYKTTAIFQWSMGGFSYVTWNKLYLASFPIIYGLILAIEISKVLDVYILGEASSTALGIDPKRLKIKAILIISLLIGTSISLCGTLPFVGLIVPHISRLIFGPSHKKLVKFSMLNSITLLVSADIIAKNILAHREIELGILTSILGAPFFIWLIFKESKNGSIGG